MTCTNACTAVYIHTGGTFSQVGLFPSSASEVPNEQGENLGTTFPIISNQSTEKSKPSFTRSEAPEHMISAEIVIVQGGAPNECTTCSGTANDQIAQDCATAPGHISNGSTKCNQNRSVGGHKARDSGPYSSDGPDTCSDSVSVLPVSSDGTF